MGCGGSKDVAGETIDYRNVGDSGSDYPPPYIPQSTRVDVYNDDVNKDIQARINAMPKGTDGSYTSLLKYLSTGATKEVQHVTAIYLWMKSQDYNSPDLDFVKAGDTPRGYMKMIKEGQGDLTSFFTILCRRSGIPCTILHGIGKSETYSIGSPERSMETSWTAVFADEEWHLAHIEWAIMTGKDGNQNETENKATDFFFFTDPDEFITMCYPDNFQWQLLDVPISQKEFMNLPNFRTHYFDMGATLLSPKTGTVKAVNGKREIEISFPKQLMDYAYLSFTVKSDTSDPEGKQPKLDKFVFVNRTSSKFIFEITYPQPGRYLFDIYGDYIQNLTKPGNKSSKKPHKGLQRLCQFRIISDKQFKEDDLDPLPDSPDIGWGPGPHCRQLGLVPLTHFDGCIYMNPGDVRDLVFRMERDLDVTCQLVHTFLPVYELVERVKCDKLHNEAMVRVQIPEEGQYALKIYCRDAGSNEFQEACVYLIRQRQRSRLPEKYRDKMLRARLEHNIKEHTSEKELADAMEAFVCFTVPDHGELKLGQEKMKQYWEIKRELRTAIKGRNMHVVHKWVEKAKRSKYRADLQADITEGEQLEGKLTKMGGHRHPMMKLDQHTITEIHNYVRPPMVVQDVMTSTYLLLGERREYLQDWDEIQYLMNKPGKDSLQKRISCRRPEDVHIEVAEEADQLIQPYTIEKCRDVSNGICSFYKWNKQFIKEVRQIDAEESERRRRHFEWQEEERQKQEKEDAEKSRTSTPPSAREPITYIGRSDSNKKLNEGNRNEDKRKGDPNNEPEEGSLNEEKRRGDQNNQPEEGNFNEEKRRGDSNKQQKQEKMHEANQVEQNKQQEDDNRNKAKHGDTLGKDTKQYHKEKLDEKHPFEVEEKRETEQPKGKFVMNPSKPSGGKQQSPISYAGWKPSDS